MHEDEEDAAGQYALPPPSENQGSYRERSANLWADPKLREIKHYTKSHHHERRLRAAAELEERQAATAREPQAKKPPPAKFPLRSDGCDAVDRHMKSLATEKATVPTLGGDAELPEMFRGGPPVEPDADMPLEVRQALVRRMDRFHTRLQWRDHMDHSLRRLLIDMELAKDDRLREYSYKARCDHLDRIYDWYVTHGMKEVRKERVAPPYVRFDRDGPVMPGSLRAAPRARLGDVRPAAAAKAGSGGGGGAGGGAQGLVHSASSPTLMVAGSLGLDSAASSPAHGGRARVS